jgi:hypothetical protein
VDTILQGSDIQFVTIPYPRNHWVHWHGKQTLLTEIEGSRLDTSCPLETLPRTRGGMMHRSIVTYIEGTIQSHTVVYGASVIDVVSDE